MEPTRRQVVHMLAALGLSRRALAAAQSKTAIGPDDLRGALAIQGRVLPDDEIEVIRLALQWSLDKFQRVRDLEIEDQVVPAVMFEPRSE
jgi:hypothetical protein